MNSNALNNSADTQKRLFDPETGAYTPADELPSKHIVARHAGNGIRANTTQETGRWSRQTKKSTDNGRRKQEYKKSGSSKGQQNKQPVPRLLLRTDKEIKVECNPTIKQKALSDTPRSPLTKTQMLNNRNLSSFTDSQTKGSKANEGPSLLTKLHQQNHMSSRIQLISQAGKLDADAARVYLGSVKCRKVIGTIGRSCAGKSLILSYLARPTAPVFPSSSEYRNSGSSNNIRHTSGVDFFVSPSRCMFVDSPPVMQGSRSSGKERKANRKSMREETALRLFDLQLATWLLHITDELVVVIPVSSVPSDKTNKKNDKGIYNEALVDGELIDLLKQACDITPMVPGLLKPQTTVSSPEPSNDDNKGIRSPCRIHLAFSCTKPISRQLSMAIDSNAIAYEYSLRVGMEISRVSIIPHLSDNRPRFSNAIERNLNKKWSEKDIKLYPSQLAISDGKPTMFAWRDLLYGRFNTISSSCSLSFGDAVDRLRFDILRETVVGDASVQLSASSGNVTGHLTKCIGAWESIRRSDQIQGAVSATPETPASTISKSNVTRSRIKLL